MRNLLNLDLAGLQAYMQSLGEPPYRAQSLLRWIHRHGVIDFARMTDMSKALRSKLIEQAQITVPQVIREHISLDGTHKWLLQLPGGNAIETVFIPEVGRGTLCVSSQVGCALNCSFCATGKEGFNRNLSLAEIIGQLWVATRKLAQSNPFISPVRDTRATVSQGEVLPSPWETPAPLTRGQAPKISFFKITNVVMMGMGEPLLNYDAVVGAMDLMMSDHAYGLSKYKITLSTAGVVPAMQRLRLRSPVALAVSLHAPNDALRNELVPLNKKYPLSILLAACRDYFPRRSKRSVVFEYVMLDGVNDQSAHAQQLIDLLNFRCKINLIPFNSFDGSRYRCSPQAVITQFQQRLMAAGFNTRVRRTRGDDIAGACGQLAGKIIDRTGRHQRWLETGYLVPLTDRA